MSNDIRTGLSGVSALRLSGRGSGSRAGAALSSLAAQIAGHVADTLNLAAQDDQSDRRRGKNFITANDLYEIEALSGSLSRDLSANGSEAVRLTAALHQFAERSATLLGARPAAYSVEHLVHAIDDAVGDGKSPEDFESVLATIEKASLAVENAQ
ncbi:hypothetical protein [Parasphingorhabdus cellanae]|uniref:Uncharacterized protein n=1 Tax=Parasphingorhabdus cellanae TaxID=2806553 RepID=A0ABX7T7F5_9SPHN|nr:hypothetical protein [Parasphingorhabdus cellanae]QTD56145.1 hypothetical protein J4G78_00615 [Parasphingorhabdus cellanae]